MAVRSTGGTLRTRLFSAQEVSPPTLTSGPGQGKSWESGPAVSPLSRAPGLSAFGGGPVGVGTPDKWLDGSFRSNRNGTGIERKRAGDY